MGIFSKIRKEVGRATDKVAIKEGGSGINKYLNLATYGALSEGMAKETNNFQWNPSLSRMDALARGTAGRFSKYGLRGHNAGKQLFDAATDISSGPDAPSATPLPSIGAGAQNAKQKARKRAMDAAMSRFGLKDTVGTTPLGLTGQGASLGKKTLTGE